MNPVWTALFVAQWVVVAALAFTVVGLLRQLGLLQLRLGVDPGVLITDMGLPRGSDAPAFSAPSVRSGEYVSLSELRGKRTVLIFLSTGCLACRELIPHINTVWRDYRDDTNVIAICSNEANDCAQFGRVFKLSAELLCDPLDEIASSFGIDAKPFAFLIDGDGKILIRGVVNSWPQLESLLREEGTVQQHDPVPTKESASMDTLLHVN